MKCSGTLSLLSLLCVLSYVTSQSYKSYAVIRASNAVAPYRCGQELVHGQTMVTFGEAETGVCVFFPSLLIFPYYLIRQV